MAHAQAQLGMLKGARVLAFMVSWETARSALGDEWPATGVEAQVRAAAAWWREAERTTWYQLARFRECFPGEETPSRLMDELAAEWDRSRGVRGLGAVALPA
jgi:hypothetical protein